ncbi:hypothetical protein RRG08_048256 [Elysia crispata]|uniref:Sorbitol dehydrogenase n=1 Tax=Elysia crispata TaxID=231223 RepID=A0AAE0ZTA6_9GAST|nr:hypothetical protein RRG08_048256 [Elysia crispata]
MILWFSLKLDKHHKEVSMINARTIKKIYGNSLVGNTPYSDIMLVRRKDESKPIGLTDYKSTTDMAVARKRQRAASYYNLVSRDRSVTVSDSAEMADTNLSLVLHGTNDLRLEERPIPESGPEEVQISIRSVGLCGSDVSYWQKGRIGSLVVTKHMVLGHEPSGVVTKLGSRVNNLMVGDRVAVEPNRPCGTCYYCKRGRYNICADLHYLATPPQDGCITRYFCHPARFVYWLPDNLSFDEGALAQPLALGFYGCERGGLKVGHYLLVTGAGPMGMSTVLAAKASGACKICVTDIIESRLDFIRKIGADVTVLAPEDEDPEVTAKRIVELMEKEPDVSIECSGSESGINTAVHSTRPTGTVVQVGIGRISTQIPLTMGTLRELNIVGSSRFANNYETVLEAISIGRVNVKQLVTHRFPLEESLKAYTATLNREGVKVIVDCSRQENGKST